MYAAHPAALMAVDIAPVSLRTATMYAGRRQFRLYTVTIEQIDGI